MDSLEIVDVLMTDDSNLPAELAAKVRTLNEAVIIWNADSEVLIAVGLNAALNEALESTDFERVSIADLQDARNLIQQQRLAAAQELVRLVRERKALVPELVAAAEKVKQACAAKHAAERERACELLKEAGVPEQKAGQVQQHAFEQMLNRCEPYARACRELQAARHLLTVRREGQQLQLAWQFALNTLENICREAIGLPELDRRRSPNRVAFNAPLQGSMA